MQKISSRRALRHKWDMRRTRPPHCKARQPSQDRGRKDWQGGPEPNSVSGQDRSTALLNSEHLGLRVHDSHEIKPINAEHGRGKSSELSPLRIYGQLASGKGELVFFKVWSLASPPSSRRCPHTREYVGSTNWTSRKRGYKVEGVEMEDGVGEGQTYCVNFSKN